MRIFFWILATSATNSLCLYGRVGVQKGIPASEQQDLLEFTCSIASSLVMKRVPERRPEAGHPVSRRHLKKQEKDREKHHEGGQMKIFLTTVLITDLNTKLIDAGVFAVNVLLDYASQLRETASKTSTQKIQLKIVHIG